MKGHNSRLEPLVGQPFLAAYVIGLVGANFVDDRLPSRDHKPRIAGVSAHHKFRDHHRNRDARD